MEPLKERELKVQGQIVTCHIDLIGDPALADAAREDHHLAAGLAAIDQGEQAGVTVDKDGQSRPAGAGYDISADEYWYEVYLPLVMQDWE